MFCSKCRKELEDGAAFCQFCGQKQTEDSSEKTEKEAGKREEQIGNKQLLLAGVVIAAVILAVIAGFKLVVGDRKEKAAGEIATQETAQEENDSEELTEKMPKEESAEPIGAEEAQEEEENAETEAAAKQETTEKPYVSHIETGENEYWFDEDGDLVESKRGTYREEFQYLTDAAGNKVTGKIVEKMLEIRELENIDSWGMPMNVCATPYNGKGHLLESWNWEGDWSSGSVTYAYDGENVMEIHMMEQQNDGEFDSKSVLEYDEENDQFFISSQFLSRQSGEVYESWENFTYFFENNHMTGCVYEDDSRTITMEWEYDEGGNLIRKKCEDLDNTYEAAFQYQYNKYGNIIQMVKEMQETREGEKYNDDYITIEYQYDESGNKIQEKFNQVSPEYDEANTVVRQSAYDRNYIWEYDAEGKLTYYSFISSAAGKDVVANESEYLYDEQGRLSEIQKDGETTLMLNYSDERMLRQIELVKELEGTNWIEWNAIEKLFPNGEMAEIAFFSNSAFVLNGDNIVIEYR